MEKTNDEITEKESNYGKIFKITRSLIVAEEMAGAKMYELVKIGPDQIIGEIVKLSGDTAYIQCYEDTTKLSVGDPVLRTKEPLLIHLGPGILDNIFDGIQRPLETMAKTVGKTFIPKGVSGISLDEKKEWEFKPNPSLKVGVLVTGGDVIGTVVESTLFKEHRILLPPKARGRIASIAAEGQYTIKDTIIELEYDGKIYKHSMSHTWPARQPRPFVEKLPGKNPFITGHRVLDALFPPVLGGAISMPGAFGCGKGILSQAIVKYSNSDAVIYTASGERGNELVEMLQSLPELMSEEKGHYERVMQRTCLVSNTSNMPIAAKEVAFYTGMTLAEYYRDMGYNVSMIADSTSRWAEALREISGNLGETPGEGGYPSYLTTRIAQFFERAGRIRCLGSPDREGSITLIGSVSPPAGDFTDPVTTATLNVVQTFWALDKKLAQRKHFPSVNWSVSFSNYSKQLEPYYQSFDLEFPYFKAKITEILREESDLLESVELAGRDALSEEKKLVLEVAKIIREDFLQQDVYSLYDCTCPLYKTIGMMKCIVNFFDQAQKIIKDPPDGQKITVNMLKVQMAEIIKRLTKLKSEDPNPSKRHEVASTMNKLVDDMTLEFEKQFYR